MSIINIQRIQVGQVGAIPSTIKMVTTDNLATITAAGYLNINEIAGGIAPTDVFEVTYSYANGTGSYGIFTVSISNGSVTLVQWVDSSNVLLPVTSGDMPVFNGTSGQIKDSGAAMTNASSPFIVTSPGSLTSGNVVKLADAKGTIADAGFNVLTVDVSITLAQFLAMQGTPIAIIPAPGANKVAIVLQAMLNLQYGSAQLATGGNTGLIYGNSSHIGSGAILASTLIAAADLTGATANQLYNMLGMNGGVASGSPVSMLAVTSSVANTGIYLNAATNFTVGTGASFFLRALYTILPTNS